MRLRSGIFVRSGLTPADLNCRIFKKRCCNFIRELNDSVSPVNTLHILYKMYSFLDSESDNISSYLNLYIGLKSFLMGAAHNIPTHIMQILSCEREYYMDITWNELTGFNAVEIGRMMYNLRFKMCAIIDEFT
jgi:hypothetical protein